ncbi:hypothetical protein [Aurantimonas sp. 22II-16-19i]|uniref:hypothetical protein n=1 Tax=Aurantimonas sp. 22II-16-19i TaxID=1317114 RepID=UPI00111C3B61|nr:hypothetical protein [Aurantimonas sp. 22II-16-19i]
MGRGQTDLKNVRNQLRPFLFAKKKRPFAKNIQTIRATMGLEQSVQIFELCEDRHGLPFPGLGNTFPSDTILVPHTGLIRLKPLSRPRERALLIARLNFHAPKLVAALKSIADINFRLETGVWQKADDVLIDDHIRDYGWSLLLLKKILYAKLLSGGLPALTKFVRRTTESHPRRFWGVYCKFLYDLIDPTFNPCVSIRYWHDLFKPGSIKDEWYKVLLRQAILGANTHAVDDATACLRFSTASLVDSAIYVWQTSNIDEFECQTIVLDERITHLLSHRFTRATIHPCAAYLDHNSKLNDLEVYRMHFIFSDFLTSSSIRTSINYLFLQERGYNHDQWAKRIRALLDDPDITPQDIQKLSSEQSLWHRSSISPDVQAGENSLISASLLTTSLDQNINAVSRDRRMLANTLAGMEGLQDFISDQALSTLSQEAVEGGKDLLVFVAQDIIFRRHRSRDNDLERRLTLMSIIHSSGFSNVEDFIQYISDGNSATAQHIATLSTRSFLERLFLLMSSTKDVLISRIKICRWLIATNSDLYESLNDEISSLSRELETLDIRTDLDSTRIHVDEESLREWFDETQKNAVSRYTQTVLAEGPGRTEFSLLRYLNRSEQAAAEDDVMAPSEVGSEHLLLSILSETLIAFARDKSFGLDAYLSRRIRHGTLSGSVMTPLTRVANRLQEVEERDEKVADFAQKVEEWRKETAAELDDARRNVIQLNHVNPERGLIRADWGRVASVAHLDAAMFQIRDRVYTSKGGYDLFPDLYALCWDCTEADLALLRMYLLRTLLPKINNGLVDLWNACDPRTQAHVYPVVSELVATSRQKIHEVCGWFIRPVFRRDSYSLRMLVTSTLSIVRELDPDYKFAEDVRVDEALLLNRASFDAFGDILFVIIGNAAKYGSKGGKILVQAESGEDGASETVIVVSIHSEVDTLATFEHAKLRIESALSPIQEEIDSAAVQEGFTGLRKAVGIMRNIRSESAALIFYAHESELRIEFNIYLPASILTLRGR